MSEVAVGRRRPPKVFVGAQLPGPLHQRLVVRAERSGRSLAAEVRRGLRIYVELDETAALLLEERERSAEGEIA
jgi:plasmid stability protein